jgi:Mg/Co/Ni transporter MgtE
MSRIQQDGLVLNEEQQADAQRIFERLGSLFDDERMRIARLLASKADPELFGKTEYELRDRVHHLGAEALQVAANERQKKGRVRGC